MLMISTTIKTISLVGKSNLTLCDRVFWSFDVVTLQRRKVAPVIFVKKFPINVNVLRSALCI